MPQSESAAICNNLVWSTKWSDDTWIKRVGIEYEYIQFLHTHYAPSYTMDNLVQTFYFFKLGAQYRAFSGNARTKIRDVTFHLAETLDIITWEPEPAYLNPSQEEFVDSLNIVGAVDSFPIRICSPGDPLQAALYYQPKYKAPCIKSTIVVDLRGVPIHFATGNVGSTHDIKCYREEPPPPVCTCIVVLYLFSFVDIY